jgi:hypothetical protein
MSHISIGRRRAAAAVGVAALAVALVAGAAGAAAQGALRPVPGVADGEYTLILDSSNAFASPSSGSGVASTAMGNEIAFACSGASASEGNFIALAAGGSLSNSTAISGITSIAVASDQAMTLSYWWSAESEALAADLAANGSFSFAADRPSHFRVKASSATAITSLTVKYMCSAESAPSGLDDTTPTSGLPIVYDSSIGSYKVKDGKNFFEGSYTGTSASVHIPAYYDDGTHGKRPVTAIGRCAFGSTSITSVDIPSSVTAIGGSAFFGSHLTSISIPASVISINNTAFQRCASLQSINVDSGNLTYKSSGDGRLLLSKDGKQLIVAATSGMTTYSIPSSVTDIGVFAFQAAPDLESVVIPSSVKSIGFYAFSETSSLASVSFTSPSSLTTIGNNAFSNAALKSISIPASVTSIDSQTFYDCSALASVVFEAPSNLKSIKNNAFGLCSSISSLDLPASVTSIDNAAFNGCSSLQSVTVDPGNQKYKNSDDNRLLLTKDGTHLVLAATKGMTAYSIPSSVTDIGSFAFDDASDLESVVIPSSVTAIGRYAFADAASLISVSLPSSSLATIGDFAFSRVGIKSIRIPASVTSIGDWAFNSCKALASVVFGGSSNLESIGYLAFNNCSLLSSIRYNDTVAKWNNISQEYGAFKSVPASYATCTDGNGTLKKS